MAVENTRSLDCATELFVRRFARDDRNVENERFLADKSVRATRASGGAAVADCRGAGAAGLQVLQEAEDAAEDGHADQDK